MNVGPLVLGVLVGCARLGGEACPCPNGAHGALYQDRCGCLPAAPGPPEQPAGAVERFVDPDVAPGGDGSAARPWQAPDWPALDALLATDDVVLFVSAAEADGATPERLPRRLDILRGDPGPRRLVIDGRSRFNASDDAPTWRPGPGVRARVPGVLTPYEGVYGFVTVQGLEVTGSRDKGVYWRAGDEVVLRDLVIHDNAGSPAVMLDYSNRSGHRSSSFTLVDSHVFNQPGECVYVGGAEGTREPSHARVVIARNLVHHCRNPWDTRHDGINIKDGIGAVEVTSNVVYAVDWGIEAASPGVYANNLILDTDREGLQVNDAFGPVAGLAFVDNVVVGAGHDGVNLATNTGPAEGISLVRTTVFGARGAGLMVGGAFPVELEVSDLVVVESGVGVDGWGTGAARVAGCRLGGNAVATDRNLADAPCTGLDAWPTPDPPGADGVWGSADDGVWIDGGARPLTAPRRR